MPLKVISYTLKEIHDDSGYLKGLGFKKHHININIKFYKKIVVVIFETFFKALGLGRTAEVKRDGRIGAAMAMMASSVKVKKLFSRLRFQIIIN